MYFNFLDQAFAFCRGIGYFVWYSLKSRDSFNDFFNVENFQYVRGI